MPTAQHGSWCRQTARVAILAAFALAPPLASQAPDAPEGLRPGDVVRITVWRNEQLSGEFAIVSDGTIAHPLYRNLQAVGTSQAELERRVRERILQFEGNPQFVVQPLYRVAVGGEVRTPNLYTLAPEVTLLQAVASAGGMTERGRLDRVQLIRGGETRILDLSDPVSGDAMLTVRSGDQIYVARRRNVFRENIGPVASVIAAVTSLYRVLRR